MAKRTRRRGKKSKRDRPGPVRARAVKEEYFVGIRDPIEVRKELLLGSKDLITSLKKYDNFTHVREEKQKYIEQLKRIIDELLVLNKRLRTHLPKTPLKGPIEAKKVVKAPKRERTPKDKVELLERELSRVESRLKALE